MLRNVFYLINWCNININLTTFYTLLCRGISYAGHLLMVLFDRCCVGRGLHALTYVSVQSSDFSEPCLYKGYESHGRRPKAIINPSVTRGQISSVQQRMCDQYPLTTAGRGRLPPTLNLRVFCTNQYTATSHCKKKCCFVGIWRHINKLNWT